MKMEVLYIEGCPHFRATVEAVREALGQLGLTCPIVETKVGDQDMAVNIGFSDHPPSVHHDVDLQLKLAYKDQRRTHNAPEEWPISPAPLHPERQHSECEGQERSGQPQRMIKA